MENKPNCHVTGCNRPAYVEVILYDVYLETGTVFFERDRTCPYLCESHMVENERGARSPLSRDEAEDKVRDIFQRLGSEIPVRKVVPASIAKLLDQEYYGFPAERKLRGHVQYPFSNRNSAQGFTIYRPVS